MSDPVSIEIAVRDATEKLRVVSEAPRLEAELLMARAINMPRSFLFAHPEDELDDASLQRLIKQGAVRVDGEKVSDQALVVAIGAEHLVQVGKRRFARVRICESA